MRIDLRRCSQSTLPCEEHRDGKYDRYPDPIFLPCGSNAEDGRLFDARFVLLDGLGINQAGLFPFGLFVHLLRGYGYDYSDFHNP